MSSDPVLVEVERSGFVESRHRGMVVALTADGSEIVRLGAAGEPVFPRSAVKPIQAVAMVRSGLALEGELLALAAASHSGEDFHQEGVLKILSAVALTPGALRCPAQWPMESRVAFEVARTGAGPSRTRMNCSGKHAAMLATCVVNGWPTGAGGEPSYLAPGHPLQLAVRAEMEELAGEPIAGVGVDGCGAPLFAVSLTGVARAFRRLVLAEPGTPEREVADAVRAHPEWNSGTRREERRLMEAIPGLLLKCGAEGVYAFALPDGRAGALKVEDGAARASTPVIVGLLRAFGVPSGPVLDELATVPLRGGDEIVGAVRLAPGALPEPR
jgi:L-asparaginase II